MMPSRLPPVCCMPMTMQSSPLMRLPAPKVPFAFSLTPFTASLSSHALLPLDNPLLLLVLYLPTLPLKMLSLAPVPPPFFSRCSPLLSCGPLCFLTLHCPTHSLSSLQFVPTPYCLPSSLPSPPSLNLPLSFLPFPPTADFTVLWDSTSFARRAIADGQRVTWVWNDDNYHELRGPVSSEPFLGFGAGRLGLSRLATCAWDNIGPRDAMDEPAPCVLRSPGDKAGAHFTYTKVFGTAQDMTVKDSPQSLASTLLRATPHPGAAIPGTKPPPATSLRPYEQLLATRCAPACALAMLANGRCDPACNVVACDFDGGDCACAAADAAGAGGSSSGSAGADVQWCECSVLQTRGVDGDCDSPSSPILPPLPPSAPSTCAVRHPPGGSGSCNVCFRATSASPSSPILLPLHAPPPSPPPFSPEFSRPSPACSTACCEAAGVGEGIKVPFRLRRFGSTVHPLDATPATNASLLPRTVSQYNRCRTVSQYNRCHTVSQYNRCRTVSQYNRCRTVSQYNRCRAVSQYSRCFHCVMLPLRISSLCLLPTQLLPSMSGLTTVLRAPLTHSAMRCVPLCMYRAWLACVASRSVLVGLVIVQYRWNSDRCGNSRFHFQDACVGGESSRAFGVNPVFLPSSSLYNPNVAVSNTTAFTNQPFANPFELNAKGLPFGFQQLVSPTSPSPMRTTSPSSPDPFLPLPGSGRFPIVFDVNLDNAGATRRLQYLVDGFFIDNYTRTIHVGLITRNANEHLFTATKATLTVQSGGSMEASFQVQPVNVEYYNMNESSNVLRLVVELLFVAAVAWSIVEEVKEMLWTWKVQRRSFWHYASKGWNWVDWLSIALQITAIAIWISVAVTRAQGFTIQPHYDIYYTLDDNPRYWSLPNPPVGYQAAMSAVDTLGFVTNLCAVYFALQGINVFIMVLRLLKLMDFQPNMGIMTRSLRVAMPSLLHFFILFFVVFVAYATYGYLVFGMTLVQFSTLWLSLQTCFYMIVGQFGVFWFQQMVGWQYAAAMVFWFSFVIIFCFILFNFLIAIIVDAFMAVKESTEKAPAIYQDMYLIVVRFVRRVASPYTRYSRLLRHLIRLGAENTANAVMEKSLQQSGQQCFASSLQCGKEMRGSKRDTDGGRLEDAVRDGNPGINGVEVVGREGKMDPFEAQQQVSAMVGADETNLSRAESKKGVLPNGGVAKSQAAGSTNTQVDAHASTTPAANPGSTAAGDAGSTGGSMVEPAVQRRRSFWRLKTLDDWETVVVVGERQLNAHSLSSILRRAHARM
ncbi:unnamed protein product, partial [Closterium sp. NIES-64]